MKSAVSTANRTDVSDLFGVFETQYRADGARIAVECGGQRWTYAQLYEKAARLAEAMRAAGLKKGQPVAVSLRRSFDLIAAILAVVRAGAVFAPVDPALPKERIRSIMAHLAPAFWLIGSDVAKRLPTVESPWVVVDSDEAFPPARQAAVLAAGCAYVVFTSGSTGDPKGVMVSHASLMNYLQWAAGTYFTDPQASGALLHTSISFDLSFTALFTPLLVGQPILMVPEENPAQAIVDVLQILGSGRRLALLKLTPSHLISMSHVPDLGGKTFAVGSLVIGGEALSGKVVSWALERFPGAVVFNEYGPSETTVGCLAHPVGPGEEVADNVPIGKPIANTLFYILDADGNHVPVGTPGELYVGGEGVALGYYNAPELTTGAFIADPLNSARTVYRTGDRVRQLLDRNLQFLDRLDRQIKIRGHRIEPMEIESLLGNLPDVEQAVVMDAKSGPDASIHLVAFVKLTGSRPFTSSISEMLRQYLEKRVPRAAVPDRYIPLETVPLTGSGKVDYEALRRVVTAPESKGVTEPGTDTERTLMGIWKSVLGLERIDVDDNYFALGGDSIRSIRIASEAQHRGLTISVADVHKHTSLRKLAAAIDGQQTLNVTHAGSGAFCLLSAEDRARIPEGIEDAYPLNLLQEGMIYHRAFSPKSAVYHAMLGLHIEGEFELGVMRQAIQELVDRHPVLRTEFDLTNYSRPVQLVHRHIDAPIEFHDLRDLAIDQRRLAIEAWMAEEKRRGFEFNQVPLIRFAIHQFAADEFHLTYSYHHEIVDGWSEATMNSQLLNHYFSLMNGRNTPMKKPRSTFRDSIMLERQALESAEHKAFWAQYLKDATLLRLPRLLSGPKADKGEREIVKKPVVISEKLSVQVKDLARELAVPVSSVLLCAHMFVLRQYSSYNDVLTHMVSNGRPEDGDGQNTLGLFVNSFTFRMRFTQGTWASAIADVLREEQRSIEYRRYPMAELKRQQGGEPLSETLFFYTNYHVYQSLEEWDKHCALRDINLYGESTFPFCAICKTNPFTNRLQMRIEYDVLQFAPELIDSMAASYLRVLQAMVDNPHSQFRFRPLLSSAEHARMVQKWNDRPLRNPADDPVHVQIEHIARQAPDTAALTYNGEIVTYETLDSRAAQLARYLMREGIDIESKIAICLSSPVETIVVMLAVLKAGGCYVPLSAEYSDERSIRIVEDANAFCVVVDSSTSSRYDALSYKKLAIDTAWAAVARAGAVADRRVHRYNAAYCIYTSGSSGKPKGVVVTHDNLAVSTAARIQYYGRSETERSILVSPFCFDSSVATIYGTLAAGGTLILFRNATQFDLGQLETTIAEECATSLLCIPNVYGSLLESAATGSLSRLQRVIVAGEVCPKDLYEQHRKLLAQVDFYNEYGPTEATVWSVVWKGGTSKLLTQVPIGQGIPGTQVYLVNHELQPVPTGVQGEIYLAGPGLAREYDRNPAATAENFIPDPFGAVPGARLYRTQDLGRFLLDGNIEFLGRRDQQVKVQGFRIEIGEVEAAVNSFEKVKRSVVHAETGADGQKRLVAYVVPTELSESLESELRRHLREKLPKYMQPRSFVFLHALPLTESGKIDYGTLPSVTVGQLEQREIARPRDAVEECIVGIWSQVLGNSEIGIHDGFFDLGGESLRAMQIVSRVRKVFGVTVPMESFVIHGATIAEVSSYVRKSSGAVRVSPGA